MKDRFDRSVVVGLGLLIAILFINAATSYRNTRQLNEDARWVAHTHETLDSLEDLLGTMRDAETGQRGYLITGDRTFLEPFDSALRVQDQKLDRVRSLTSESSKQLEQLGRLEKLVPARLAEARKAVQMQEMGQVAQARQLVESKIGKNLMDEIRSVIHEMKTHEESLLLERQQTTRRAYITAILTGLIAATLCCFAVLAFVWVLNRHMQAQKRSAAIVQLQKELLHATVTSIGDGVIATDANGFITFLNSVAQELTGWSQKEASGQPLVKVFRIVNETTRKEVENPALRALKEGEIIGLANHTILIAKDGTERPIDDSAAPIRDGETTNGAVLVFRDISERRQAEQRLAESEARKTAILFTALDCIITIDHHGKIVDFNPAAERTFCYRMDEAIGKDIRDLIVPPEMREQLRKGMSHYLANGQESILNRRLELVAMRADGTRIPIELSITPIAGGDRPLFTGYLRDITERRDAEQRKAEQMRAANLLAAIVQTSDDAIISKSLDGIVQTWNAAAERLFGHTAEQAVGKHISFIIPSDRIHEEERIIAQLRAGEHLDHFDTIRLRRDGSLVHVTITISPLRDELGRVIGASKIVRDISDRIEVERALRESEERAAFVRRSSGIGFWYCNLPFEILEWDELTKSHFHLPPDAAVTIQAFFDRIHPDDREPTRRAIDRSISERSPYDTDYRTVDPATGAVKWVRAIGRTFYAEDGTATRFDGITLDITDRKQAEETLRESEERYRTLVEQVQEHAIFGLDIQGRATTWNEGVRRVLGFEEAEFIGRDIKRLIFTPEDVQAGIPQAELNAAADRGSASDDRWMMKKDGTRFFALGVTNARRDDTGRLLGFTKVMRDMTEQKRLADELRQIAANLSESDRRKTEFLAMLAHELRNPLAPIRNAVEIVSQAGYDPELVRRSCEMVGRQVNQMVRFVDDLLDVSRITRGKIELRRGQVELSLAINHAVETARPLYDAKQHELQISVPASPIFINGDPARLSQVVGNLLTNAAKFTDPGGKIELIVQQDGSEAVIRVRDNGIGIPADHLSRVFELFTQVDTSIERSQSGLGIGLTLVKNLVEMHGGSVDVASPGLGQGTEFVVRLPALANPTTPTAEPVAAADRPRLQRRILLVDDNRDAAESLAMLLSLSGHEVNVAHDGEEAVQAAGRLSPDVVLLDIGLPKLNGYEVARQIRQQPGGQSIMLLALTGWGQDEDRARSAAAGFDHHLVKPVDIELIMKLLGRADGGRSLKS